MQPRRQRRAVPQRDRMELLRKAAVQLQAQPLAGEQAVHTVRQPRALVSQ
jgi:hypothetical protein